MNYDFQNDPRTQTALAIIFNLQEVMADGMDDLTFIHGQIDMLRRVLLMDIEGGETVNHECICTRGTSSGQSRKPVAGSESPGVFHR